MSNVLFGIHFGSKLAGNTVISLMKQNKIYFLDVDADVDADIFIYNAAKHFKPHLIFIDAPLSVPGALQKLDGCTDFDYREADKKICAISPMVIGCITARAMKLKHKLENEVETKVYETNSKAQANNYDLLTKGYKNKPLNLVTCRNHINSQLNNRLMFRCQDVKTWDHLDAMLALVTGLRFLSGQALPYGNSQEGVIYV